MLEKRVFIAFFSAFTFFLHFLPSNKPLDALILTSLRILLLIINDIQIHTQQLTNNQKTIILVELKILSSNFQFMSDNDSYNVLRYRQKSTKYE